MSLAGDLDAMYSDLLRMGMAVEATVGGTTAAVVLDQPSGPIFGSLGNDRTESMRYRAASFPTLASGATVTIGGKTYRAGIPEAIADGLEKIVPLSEIRT